MAGAMIAPARVMQCNQTCKWVKKEPIRLPLWVTVLWPPQGAVTDAMYQLAWHLGLLRHRVYTQRGMILETKDRVNHRL